MTRHDDRTRLRHMLDYAEEAASLAQDRRRSDLDTDRLFRHALTHVVEVVGEAAAHVSGPLRQAHADIPWGERSSACAIASPRLRQGGPGRPLADRPGGPAAAGRGPQADSAVTGAVTRFVRLFPARQACQEGKGNGPCGGSARSVLHLVEARSASRPASREPAGGMRRVLYGVPGTIEQATTTFSDGGVVQVTERLQWQTQPADAGYGRPSPPPNATPLTF